MVLLRQLQPTDVVMHGGLDALQHEMMGSMPCGTRRVTAQRWQREVSN